MSGWSSLSVDIPDVGTETFADIIDNIKDALTALVGVLEFILSILVSFDDPLAATIQALIDELKATVESFLDDTGAYVLHVPIRKRLQTNFLGLGDITPSWAGRLGIFGEENSQVDYTDPELNTFLANANRYNGGNVGFFKTVLESLNDEGDLGRPQFFNDDDYVGGMVLLMGTDFDPLGFLDDIWTLNGMFNVDTTPKVPRPKNLRGYTLKGISDGSFDTMLTWDVPEVPVYTLADLGGIVLYPERYAIIRGKNTIGAMATNNVVSLMGKRDLAEGDTFSNGDLEVIHEGEYDFTKVTYLDEGLSGTKDDAFFYTVAWKLRAFGANESQEEGNGTLLDYWYISNVVRLTPFPSLPDSTPPNWHRTSSIADIFPAFAHLLRKLVAQIEGFSAKLLGSAQLLEQYVTFLKKEIMRYEAIVTGLLDAVAALDALFQLPKAGVYLRTFQGTGGNDFFVTDLAKSLMASYEGAPPFHRGDEFVTGTVIMTGGSENIVNALITGLGWILGSSSDDGTADMLNQLGESVQAMEEVYFNDDLTQAPTAPKEPVEFDVTMCPVACSPTEQPTTEFGPNMEVIPDADA